MAGTRLETNRGVSRTSLLASRGAKRFGRFISTIARHAHRWGWLPDDRDVVVLHDVPYSRLGGKQSIDVYLPRSMDRSRLLPFAIVVHGGGWVIGDRKMGALMGRLLASQGIPVVTPGYRLAPAHSVDQQLDDLHRALAFTLESAERFGLDASRYALIGESAGAHLMMRVLQDFRDVGRPRAIVGFYGPYDLEIYHRARLPILRAFLRLVHQGGDPEELVRRHGALRELPWNDLPVLLVHGGSDRFVPVENSLRMKEVLERQGAPVELRVYPGAGHGFNYQRLMQPHHTEAAYRELVGFFRANVG